METPNRRICVHNHYTSIYVNEDFERIYKELIKRNDNKFFRYTRMTRSSFEYILKSIGEKLQQ